MPAGAQLLPEFEVEVPARPFLGVCYHLGVLSARATFTAGNGLGIQRTRFDEALLERASRVARVRDGARVDGPILERGRVAGLVVDGEPHRAHLTIAADGVHSPLRRSLGIPVRRGLSRFAVRAHFLAAWDAFVDVYWGREEEIYVTPLPGGLVSVARLAQAGSANGPPAGLLTAAIARFPALADRLLRAEPLDATRGAASWNLAPVWRQMPGLFLHGDAAGYVDPMTGGGMTQALLASRLIASHLANGIPDSLAALDRDRQRLLRNYRLLTKSALWLAARPALSLASFQVLRFCPGLFSRLLTIAGSAR